MLPDRPTVATPCRTGRVGARVGHVGMSTLRTVNRDFIGLGRRGFTASDARLLGAPGTSVTGMTRQAVGHAHRQAIPLAS